jgi:hypothetical protein
VNFQKWTSPERIGAGERGRRIDKGLHERAKIERERERERERVRERVSEERA